MEEPKEKNEKKEKTGEKKSSKEKVVKKAMVKKGVVEAKKKIWGWIFLGLFVLSAGVGFGILERGLKRKESELLTLKRNLSRAEEIGKVRKEYPELLERVEGSFLKKEEVVDFVTQLEEFAAKQGLVIAFHFESQEPVLMTGKGDEGLLFSLEAEGSRGQIESFLVEVLKSRYLIDFDSEVWEISLEDQNRQKLRLEGVVYTGGTF
jgi:hypothetical protein